mmetsp:Transcript_21557/g.24560  ORF Transcript_21557/g.24560 Transcript_21557/m.24560 type:complete len:161 (-) Transcript_21557:872-1354(-)
MIDDKLLIANNINISRSNTIKVERERENSQTWLEGVVFHRTIRSVYAVLLIIPVDDDSTTNGIQKKVVVRIQILDGTLATQLRSWCRRKCKIGDLLVLQGKWQSVCGENLEKTTEWTEKRFLVDIIDDLDAEEKITLKEAQHWDMGDCQKWQKKISRTER